MDLISVFFNCCEMKNVELLEKLQLQQLIQQSFLNISKVLFRFVCLSYIIHKTDIESYSGTGMKSERNKLDLVSCRDCRSSLIHMQTWLQKCLSYPFQVMLIYVAKFYLLHMVNKQTN